MLIRRFAVLAIAGPLALAAAALVMLPATATAQGVSADEGTLYAGWMAANQAGDKAKAIAAAKDYLAKYPTGQYADYLKKWLAATEVDPQAAALNAAITEKRTADMVRIGREVLAKDPENLNVLYALAFNIRRNELLASPPNYQNAPAAVEFANKAIALIQSGKTLTGVPNFNKNETLGWLTQILAVDAQRNNNVDQAIKLFEQSTAYAPLDPQVAARNLLYELSLRQTAYAEAAKAYNAIPEADRAAAETKPEVKAARDRVNAEADAVIDVAARFVALAKVKNLPAATRDKVNQALEAVYKTRFPEDTALTGLQKILQDKEAALAAPPPPPPGD